MKKRERQFNKYDMAIGLFYGVGIFLGIGIFFVGGFMTMSVQGGEHHYLAVAVFLLYLA